MIAVINRIRLIKRDTRGKRVQGKQGVGQEIYGSLRREWEFFGLSDYQLISLSGSGTSKIVNS